MSKCLKSKVWVAALCLCGFVAMPLSAAQRQFSKTWKVETSPAKKMNLDWFSGDTVQLDLTSRQSGTAFDLTDHSLIWELRGWSDFTNLYAVSTGSVVEALSGESRFELTSEQTANLPETCLGYAKAVHGDGSSVVLAWQRIKVEWADASGEAQAIVGIPSPFATDAELLAVSNALASAISGIGDQTSAVSGRVDIVEADIVDLQNVDAASLPRLTQLEGQTNLIHSALQAEADPTFTNWLAATPPLYSFTELDPAWAAGTNAIWQAIAGATDTNAVQTSTFLAYTNAVNTRFQGLEAATNSLTSDLGSLTSVVGSNTVRITALEDASITNLNQLLMTAELFTSETFDGDWTLSSSNVWTNAAGWTASGPGIDIATPGEVFMNASGDCLISPKTTNGYAYSVLDNYEFWGASLGVYTSTNGTDWTYGAAGSENVFVKYCFGGGWPPAFESAPPYVELYSVLLYGFEVPEQYGETNSFLGRSVLVGEAQVDNNPVTLRQFNAGIVASHAQKWSDYPALKDVELNGNRLMWDDNYYTQGVATNESGVGVLSIGWNRNPILQVMGGQTDFVNPYITQFSVGATTTTLRVLGSTGWRPYPEYTTNLLADPIVWTRMETNEFTSTYPTLSDGQYQTTPARPPAAPTSSSSATIAKSMATSSIPASKHWKPPSQKTLTRPIRWFLWTTIRRELSPSRITRT